MSFAGKPCAAGTPQTSSAPDLPPIPVPPVPWMVDGIAEKNDETPTGVAPVECSPRRRMDVTGRMRGTTPS
ncbi:hypothetical protein GCM10009839_93510 [Catenulispora yoronensis]|uniref:Uncharacterized protein n=1 Tax=Catenulispora yoronensis TaxID=450799 RepID=A0ABP5HAY6_9ACTN